MVKSLISASLIDTVLECMYTYIRTYDCTCTYLQYYQVITQVPEAVSDSKAIIEELNDQVTSYLGLLNDSDDIIKKVCTYVCT